MIGISRLYCGNREPSDRLRYDIQPNPFGSGISPGVRKPIVVWNCTRSCNLRCVHCYSDSENKKYEGELETVEARRFISDLADFRAPVLLFSGGEPLMRPDVFQLAKFARRGSIRTVLSTNGTLISEKVAADLKEADFGYIGVSLDGVGIANDNFRGVPGAFERALCGIRNALKAGLKVGLRFTINKSNFTEVPKIFKLAEDEGIDRICFYHLVHSGRGLRIRDANLDAEQTRKVVDEIITLTNQMSKKGLKKEILTVDNHSDGPYLFLRMCREGHPGASQALELLKRTGGNSSGNGIACVDWAGEVFSDQFWRSHSLGNVRNGKFSRIWTDLSNDFIAKLKDKRPYLKGRCARCRWLDICNGNFRARAEAATGDMWASDPACYLTDEEIALEGNTAE